LKQQVFATAVVFWQEIWGLVQVSGEPANTTTGKAERATKAKRENEVILNQEQQQQQRQGMWFSASKLFHTRGIHVNLNILKYTKGTKINNIGPIHSEACLVDWRTSSPKQKATKLKIR